MSARPRGHRSHASGKRWMQNDPGRKKDRLVEQVKQMKKAAAVRTWHDRPEEEKRGPQERQS